MIKAVLYGRYSSHAQNDASIEQQFQECRKYAKDNDIQIVDEYADRHLSGTSDKRPEFQRMIRDSAKGHFQLVICWKVDRFARNRYDAAIYKVRLKNNGVKVLYAKEAIPEGPEGILLESILEGSAEYYSANLAQNVKRGMMDNAKQCRVNGGVVPTGYMRGKDGKYAINPKEAPIVREAFELYDSGIPVKKIIVMLNNKGYRTRNGKAFTKNSLSTILKNERYTGVYIFGSVRVENGMPVIISKELFDRVQARIARNNRAPATAKAAENYILTGKLFCGHCGESMTGESGTGKHKTTYRYYKCRTQKHRLGNCDKKTVRKDYIEQLVMELTAGVVLTPEIIDLIAKAAVAIQQKEQDNSPLEALQHQLKETEKALANLLTAIEAGIITATTRERMMELEDRKTQLLLEIEQEQIEKPQVSYEQIVYYLQHMKNSNTKEKLVDIFVSKIYLYDDSLKIIYRYTQDNYDSVEIPMDTDGISVDIGGKICSDLSDNRPPMHYNSNTLRITENCVILMYEL